MKAFVTGGTGFIGQQVVRKLVERGYTVVAMARSAHGIALVEAAGAQGVPGDIANVDAMRPAMAGSDVVFHIAGWYKVGARDRQQAEKINVGGTRNVLNLAVELGVPRIVYTSTLAIYGDTHGQLVDESTPIPDGPFLSEYDRTKWQAHVQVALPLIEQGAPIIIVLPGVVYGPGDHSLIGQVMRLYARGLPPVFPAPELGPTLAYLDDIAEGHLLAAERGRPGESYILAGPAVRGKAVLPIWAKALGRPVPRLSIPPQFLKPFAPLMAALGRVVPLPELVSAEVINLLDASYWGRAEKARAELGWQPRPLEEGMRQTFAWIARQQQALSPRHTPGQLDRQAAVRVALGLSIGLLLVWWWKRRRQ